jgi:hypothetical protein
MNENHYMGDVLPVMPFWMARSFWATLLTGLLTIAAAFDIDVLARFGGSEEGALAVIDHLLPVATAIWAWFERRAPNYRLGLSAE